MHTYIHYLTNIIHTYKAGESIHNSVAHVKKVIETCCTSLEWKTIAKKIFKISREFGGKNYDYMITNNLKIRDKDVGESEGKFIKLLN